MKRVAIGPGKKIGKVRPGIASGGVEPLQHRNFANVVVVEVRDQHCVYPVDSKIVFQRVHTVKERTPVPRQVVRATGPDASSIAIVDRKCLSILTDHEEGGCPAVSRLIKMLGDTVEDISGDGTEVSASRAAVSPNALLNSVITYLLGQNSLQIHD